jgi:hypothetical protein
MDPVDVVKMQERFAQNMSEFSARIVSAWSDAAKSLHFPSGSAGAQMLDLGRQDSSAFARAFVSRAASEKVQEAMRLATEDLPTVATSWGDPDKLERIKNKWAQLCEKSGREFLGIPDPSDTAKLLEQWRWVRGYLQSSAERPAATEVPGLTNLIFPLGWPLPGMEGMQREVARAWADTYGRTPASVFLSPDRGLKGDYLDRLNAAIDAQIGFLQCIPACHAHMLSVSNSAAETVVAHLRELGSKEISPESQRLFFVSWVSALEKMFRELFRSETFLQTLTRTVKQGLDAKRQMESVLADWSSARDTANREDSDALREKLHAVERRVRLLERELHDLKRELARTCSSRNSNDEA